MKKLLGLSLILISCVSFAFGGNIESTINNYFTAVQNKDINWIKTNVKGLKTDELKIYETAFKSINQQFTNLDIKRTKIYKNYAIAEVLVKVKVINLINKENSVIDSDLIFFFEKDNQNKWKIIKILSYKDFDMVLKSYFLKEYYPSEKNPKLQKVVYNSADSGENFEVDENDVEINIDRPGRDYKNFNLPYPDYNLCKQACENDTQCKAWTYVKPNTIQGKYARCWLKNSIPSPVKNSCCISGVKNQYHPLKNSPYMESWFKNWELVIGPVLPNGEMGNIMRTNEKFGWKNPVVDLGDAMPPSGAKGSALYLHPAERNKPTVLRGKYFINDSQKALLFRVAGNRNGDWTMIVKINGQKVFEKSIDGRKWYEIEIPLQNYYQQNINVDLLIKASGWYYEYAFIDEIKLVDLKTESWFNDIHSDKENKPFHISKCLAYQNSDNYLNNTVPSFLNRNQSKIYVSCKIENTPLNTELTSQWYYVQPNGEKIFIISYTLPIKKPNYTGYITFHAEMPANKTWPIGNYEVIITKNGKPIENVSFSIK